jgi:3-dehydroquinate dehydratase/shikimate dehydrogenase
MAASALRSRPRGGLRAGEAPARRLSAEYGLPVTAGVRHLFGIVGGSVAASLAPRIYNRGFRELGLPALCLPFSVADFRRFRHELVNAGDPIGAPLRGMTVVRPHKEAALRLAGDATERARRAGAANSLVYAGGRWRAANTTGVVEPLAAAGADPAGAAVAVVGCGGAGRAIATELRRHGAAVTLVNRGRARGRYASRLLGLPWTPLRAFEPGRFDFVVNATPLAERSPFDVGRLAGPAAVVDLAYRPGSDTALVAAARAGGHLVVDGREVLAAETGSQFQLMTGHPLPPGAMEIARGEQGPR